MNYRIDLDGLYRVLTIWNSYLKRKVHMIACGGTALTFLGAKDSTKDIDLIIPEINEYKYLIKILKDIGYENVTTYGWSAEDSYIFDIFIGKKVFTTELIDSPLNVNKHTVVKEFSYLYLGVLNDYDLIITKLFRGSPIDFEDCLRLFEYRNGFIDLSILRSRFEETASYSISEEKVIKNLEIFLERIRG
jgi:hypothetical protein